MPVPGGSTGTTLQAAIAPHVALRTTSDRSPEGSVARIVLRRAAIAG